MYINISYGLFEYENENYEKMREIYKNTFE